MYRIKIEIPIRAAHRLLSYEGKCKFFHGEAYTVIAEFGSPNLTDNGMVVDFGEAKKRIKTLLDRFVDHSTILSYLDFEGINQLIKLKNVNLCLLGTGRSLIRIYTDNTLGDDIKKYEILTPGVVPLTTNVFDFDRVIKSGIISKNKWNSNIMGGTDLLNLLDADLNETVSNIITYNYWGLNNPSLLQDIKNFIKISNPTAENMARIFYLIFFDVLELGNINRVGVVESYKDSIAYYDEL